MGLCILIKRLSCAEGSKINTISIEEKSKESTYTVTLSTEVESGLVRKRLPAQG